MEDQSLSATLLSLEKTSPFYSPSLRKGRPYSQPIVLELPEMYQLCEAPVKKHKV